MGVFCVYEHPIICQEEECYKRYYNVYTFKNRVEMKTWEDSVLDLQAKAHDCCFVRNCEIKYNCDTSDLMFGLITESQLLEIVHKFLDECIHFIDRFGVHKFPGDLRFIFMNRDFWLNGEPYLTRLEIPEVSMQDDIGIIEEIDDRTMDHFREWSFSGNLNEVDFEQLTNWEACKNVWKSGQDYKYPDGRNSIHDKR